VGWVKKPRRKERERERDRFLSSQSEKHHLNYNNIKNVHTSSGAAPCQHAHTKAHGPLRINNPVKPVEFHRLTSSLSAFLISLWFEKSHWSGGVGNKMKADTQLEHMFDLLLMPAQNDCLIVTWFTFDRRMQ
jgi:hypothetical protein